MHEAVRHLQDWLPTDCFRPAFANEWSLMIEVTCE